MYDLYLTTPNCPEARHPQQRSDEALGPIHSQLCVHQRRHDAPNHHRPPCMHWQRRHALCCVRHCSFKSSDRPLHLTSPALHPRRYVFGSEGVINGTSLDGIHKWNTGIAFLFGLLSVQWTVSTTHLFTLFLIQFTDAAPPYR